MYQHHSPQYPAAIRAIRSSKLSRSTRNLNILHSKSVFGHPEASAFVAAASSVDSIPTLGGLPEVIVTGKANSGKSTLLNALIGRTTLVKKSKKAGHTRTLNFFRVGDPSGQLIVVDSPGYGSRGRVEFAEIFNSYIKSRTELKRAYLLINAVHGVLETDRLMVQHLSSLSRSKDVLTRRFTLQPVITKADTLLRDVSSERALNRTRSQITQLSTMNDIEEFILPPIVTAALLSPPFGIEQLRRSVEDLCIPSARTK